uniref:RXLR phytopathogen effector protein WY-domain domain-containing protein n=1 Tax=Peronospora matthiolae TaxID=2874970 RepID=A0AAV1TCL0_9STRA
MTGRKTSTDNSTPDLLLVPPHLKTTASVTPDNLEGNIDQGDEERWTIVPQGVTDVVHALQTSMLIRLRRPPPDVFSHFSVLAQKNGPIDVHKLTKWLKYVDSYRKVKTYDVADEVKLLVDMCGEENLVESLFCLSSVSSMHHRANALLRELDVTYSEAWKMAKSRWLAADVDPSHVYPLMPVGATETLASADGKNAFMQWIAYVDEFNQVSPTRFYGTVYVVVFLLEHRPTKELAELFHLLRGAPHMEKRADEWQRILAVMHPEIVKEMEPLWLASKMTLEEVYGLLPIALKKTLVFDVVNEPTWLPVRNELKRLLDYMEKYNAEGMKERITYSDDDLFKLLMRERTPWELAEFFHWLRGVDGMQNRAESWLEQLADKHPEVAGKLLDVWLERRTDPGEVFESMPKEMRASLATSSQTKKNRKFILLMQWLRYIEKFNNPHDPQGVATRRFGDDAVLALLGKTNTPDELMDFFRRLQSDKHMKRVAVRLQQSSRQLLEAAKRTS